MKISRSIIDSRRGKILQALEAGGTVQVNELARQLGTSPLTIRRDLDYFESLNLIERFYGGASLLSKENGGNIFSSVYTLHKHAIAQRAAQMVEDGDTIFINTSSTALLVLKYITAKLVTVITNNGKAIFSEAKDDLILVLTGGELRSPKESMVGDFALNNLNRVSATKCFLGCSGITAGDGITTAILQEVAINELMLTRVTGPKIILADHSKIGRTHSFVSGSIDLITHLITDVEASGAALEDIRARGVEIHQVEPVKSIQ